MSRNFLDLGDEIKDIVQNAVNTRDFHQLNRDISNTVHSALDEARDAIGRNQENIRSRNRQRGPIPRANDFNTTSSHTQRHSAPKTNVSKMKVSDLTVPIGRISGRLFTIFGSIGIGILGIATIVLSILGNVTGNFRVFGTITVGLLPFLLGSIFLMMIGNRIRKRVKRFYQYLAHFRDHNYCSIKELSSHIGLSNKFIVKDLRKMISIGMFPQGHIDTDKTCFMLNNEVYEEYLKMQDNIRMQNLEKQKTAQRDEDLLNRANTGGSEFKSTIEIGRSYIRQIKEANDTIPGEEISQKLYRLELVTDKIFKYVELHPDQICEIRKFMEYYLPTTLKLLNAYIEFDNQPVQGNNISSAKREIESTLDTINHAFEELLNSLFKDAALDVSTDISVLQTLLAQEGLTKKDFK